MSDAPSVVSGKTESAVAESDYGSIKLAVNNVLIVSTKFAMDNPHFAPFLSDLAHLSEIFEPTTVPRFDQAEHNEVTLHDLDRDSDPDDSMISAKAAVLADESIAAFVSDQNDRWIDLLRNIWAFFAFRETFSYCYDKLWSYDPAVTNYLEHRDLLVAPKPYYAFGLMLGPGRSTFRNQLLALATNTIPPVSPFCFKGTFAAPFLMIESKSSNGSQRTGLNQLCNAMIKAHDILNSVNLQEKCFLLGLVQVGIYVNYYFSISTQQRDGANRYTDKIYMVLLDADTLIRPAGCLKLLKYIAYAKRYGSTRFRREFENAIKDFVPDERRDSSPTGRP